MLNNKLYLIAVALATIGGCADQPESDWLVENAGPGVNTEYRERFSMISPDGLTLYISSDRPNGLGTTNARGAMPWDIYVAWRQSKDEPFTEAVNLGSLVNTPYEEHSPSFTEDGHWMFFASDRPGGCGGTDLYASYREDTADPLGWEMARNLGCELNSPLDEACPLLTTDPSTRQAAMYLVRNSTPGEVNHDIFVSIASSEISSFSDFSAFEAPVPVAELNTPTHDAHLDPRHGLLWATRTGGYGGGDLWTTQRSSDGKWSTPENMGAPINTADNEELPSATVDGEIYFPSNRSGGYGQDDIWVAKPIRR